MNRTKWTCDMSLRAILAMAALLALLGTSQASAEAPAVDWMQPFGGSELDWGYAVTATSDGGFIIAGYTESMGAGFEDGYLVKTDAAGNVLWERTYGNVAEDRFYAVTETADGGFAMAGVTGLGAPNWDAWIVRVDARGELLWQQTFGRSGDEDVVRSVIETADGGIVAAGDTFNTATGRSILVVKRAADGSPGWDSTGFGIDIPYGYAVREVAGGGLAVAGYSSDGVTFPEFDAYLARLDGEGTLQWEKPFDAGYDDRAYDMIVVEDGFVLAGKIGAAMSIWRTDTGGNLLWSNTFGSVASDYALAVVRTPDGGFALGGSSYRYAEGGEYQSYVVKTDGSGAFQWETLLGGAAYDWCAGLDVTGDGGLILAGTTNSYGSGGYDLELVRLNGVEDGLVAADLTLFPASGVLPFTVSVSAGFQNLTAFPRRVAGRLDVILGGGTMITGFRQGFTNLLPSDVFTAGWLQPLPATAALLGENEFVLQAFDVTPAPYNQPPYPGAGDTDTSRFTVTAAAP